MKREFDIINHMMEDNIIIYKVALPKKSNMHLSQPLIFLYLDDNW